MPPSILPCQRCGACCAHSPEFIPVTAEDAQHVPLEFLTPATTAGHWDTVPQPPYVMHTLEPGHRCIALKGEIGRHVVCCIYARRPAVCRALVPGSPECCYLLGWHRLGRPW